MQVYDFQEFKIVYMYYLHISTCLLPEASNIRHTLVFWKPLMCSFWTLCNFSVMASNLLVIFFSCLHLFYTNLIQCCFYTKFWLQHPYLHFCNHSYHVGLPTRTPSVSQSHTWCNHHHIPITILTFNSFLIPGFSQDFD